MADTDNATRAPESDAQEHQQPPQPDPTSPTATTSHSPSPTPNAMLAADTPAQSGPTLGQDCITDRPTPSTSSEPSGEITPLNGINTYISKPATYPSEPSRLLLLLTGGTGIHSRNNQLQADAFVAKGYVVVMPDQFRGDPAPRTGVSEGDAQAAVEAAQEVTGQRQGQQQGSASAPSLLDKIKLGAATTAKSFLIDMWLARQTPAKVLPDIQKALEGAREEFADAVANGGGIYGVGYCFGAKYILQLCGTAGDSAKHGQSDEEQGELQKGPELKVGVIAHGTQITREDVEGVRVPVGMACVDEDPLFPNEVREQGKASLELNKVEHDVRVWEGVPHGFAVVGSYGDEKIMKAQGEAFDFTVGWLERR